MGKAANKMFKEMRELDARMKRYHRQQVVCNVLTWAAIIGAIGFLAFAMTHCDGAKWEAGDYRTTAPWNYEGGAE